MFPHIRELNRCYNTHVCVLTFLGKLKLFRQVFMSNASLWVCTFQSYILPTRLALLVSLQDFECW